jgi:hypothetical protein
MPRSGRCGAAAEDGLSDDSRAGWQFPPERGLVKALGTFLVDALMRPTRIEIVAVLVEYELQMPLVQDEDVIETFSADRADRPLAMRIGLGRQLRRADDTDAAPPATASNDWPNLQSLSRIRNFGAWSGGVRLRRCCASQSDVGAVVDVAGSSRRVSRCMTTKT